ncbi:hypothetical protein TRFO_13477 [Tritrichomonas foetus]|uniref:F5/8 type C domain-containing protein n=1 Tax=Tritrichomonas foetus TaxID=1144522 RepID=A0A1J4KY18_9EUKA|nr:hypothetical protein TRFO_13477 [Tritrichomonas foetus]|eukprot:OHT16145.1 hypothetical protein TRFO_13477 [Tritrichomonas foetus]
MVGLAEIKLKIIVHFNQMLRGEYILTSKGLEDIRMVKFENNFSIQIGTQIFLANAFNACYISPKIAKLLIADLTTDSFRVPFNNKELNISEKRISFIFNQILEGKVVFDDFEELAFVIKLFEKLENNEMTKILWRDLEEAENIEELNVNNVLQRIKKKTALDQITDQEINFIAENFPKFSTSFFLELDESVFERIVSNKNLKLYTEDAFLDTILSLGQKFKKFLCYVEVQNLSNLKMKLYLENIELAAINSMLWESVKRRLLLKVEPSSKQQRIVIKSHSFKFESGKEFQGIFNYLNSKNNANAHIMGIVNITQSTSSQYHQCFKVIDYKWDDYWNSDNEINASILFDFKKAKVRLEGYSIRLSNRQGHVPREWVIEGSSDGQSWFLVHKVSFDKDPFSKSLLNTLYFDCKDNDKEYKILRIRQTGPNSTNDHYLKLTNIEFFGDLLEL